MGMPNTSNVKSGDFPPTKPDWYEMTFSESEEKIDKNGRAYLNAEFAFVDSDRKAFTNFSYQDDFLWILKQFKEAIGMSDDTSDPVPYWGTRLMVFCKNKVYDGGNWPDPRKFKAMDGGGDTPPVQPKDDDDLPF